MNERNSARLGWALFGLTLALAVVSWGLRLTGTSHVPVALAFERNEQLGPISSLVFAFVGALIVSRRHSNPIGWLCLAIGVLNNVQFFIEAYAAFALFTHRELHVPGGMFAWWLRGCVWLPPFLLMVAWIPLLFPDGKLPSGRWRRPAIAAAVIDAVGFFPLTQQQNPESPAISIPSGPLTTGVWVLGIVAIVTLLLQICAVVVALVLRYRRAASDQRQQIKWFTAAAVAYLLVVLAGTLAGLAINRPDTFRLPPFDVLWPLGQIALPVAIGFAIMRYRLYDIDVVINRALVYGALAAFITFVYVAIVVGIGQALGTGGRPNLLLSILATAIVAVAFQPARERLQKLANRFVYGARATPYQALADFSRQLSGAVSTDDVLPRVAEAAGTALGVRWTAAALLLPDGSSRTSEWGIHQGSHSETVEVRHEGELLGHIAFVSDEPLSGATLQVASNFANQAGAVFRNMRLTAELQGNLDAISRVTEELGASRQRIVAAAEDERRRLELEISRSTKRQLTEIRVGLRNARAQLEADEPGAIEALQHLSSRANETLDGLRELARGVFPPLLVDRGVVAALEAHARRSGLVKLDVDPALASERFAEPVEAALYFSCLEALRGASDARVRLREEGQWVECRVDPLGPQASTLKIQDRIEALGGIVDLDSGKSLELRLPVRAVEVAPALG